jgi:hypothetical protein
MELEAPNKTFTIIEERTYTTTADHLRRTFPDEYAEWQKNGGGTDREWVKDCLDAGGPELFTLESVDVEVMR